jgi:hypothetical protein
MPARKSPPSTPYRPNRDIRWGELFSRAGDFMVMGKDTTHPQVHTVGGNILLPAASHNEYAR